MVEQCRHRISLHGSSPYIHHSYTHPTHLLQIYRKCHVLSFFPSISLPNVLYDPTKLIWREGTPSETMTGRTDLNGGHLPRVSADGDEMIPEALRNLLVYRLFCNVARPCGTEVEHGSQFRLHLQYSGT